MDANEFRNKGKYINATGYNNNVQLREPLKITEVNADVMNNKGRLLLSFENTPKQLVLNQTNLTEMIAKKGADTLKWVGVKIQLTSVPTTFNGLPVMSLKVSVL